MQSFKITHQTYYNFTGEVSLGPHELLLRPRENHALRIVSFKLKLNPDAELHWHRDVEGNSVAIASFSTPAVQLAIESEAIIEQYNDKPLNFTVADYAVMHPVKYLEDDLAVLAPYHELPEPTTQTVVKKWISNFWQQSEEIQTYTLMQRLTEYIHANMSYKVREEPGVQSALQTLESGSGSCRDFALLFMQAAKCLGLAARFVSGYLHDPKATVAGSTHAWAEIYLPGAGWLGFDPTIGDIVGVDHIAVAVARLAESVPPVAGSFTGKPGSTLKVGVWVVRV